MAASIYGFHGIVEVDGRDVKKDTRNLFRATGPKLEPNLTEYTATVFRPHELLGASSCQFVYAQVTVTI